MAVQSTASVQSGRLRLGLVAPRPAPQLLALVGRQAAAHADDRVELLERRPALDPIAQGRPYLLHHEADLPNWVEPEPGGVRQTTNWPSRCRSSPSTVIEPPLRRSQTMSQWTAESFTPPLSG